MLRERGGIWDLVPPTYEYPALSLLYTPSGRAFMNLVKRAFRDFNACQL